MGIQSRVCLIRCRIRFFGGMMRLETRVRTGDSPAFCTITWNGAHICSWSRRRPFFRFRSVRETAPGRVFRQCLVARAAWGRTSAMQLRHLKTVLSGDDGIKKVTAIAWCVSTRRVTSVPARDPERHRRVNVDSPSRGGSPSRRAASRASGVVRSARALSADRLPPPPHSWLFQGPRTRSAWPR